MTFQTNSLIHRLQCTAIAVVFSSLTLTAQDTVTVAPPDLATTPAVQDAAWAAEWWMPRHQSKLDDKNALQTVDLLWIGDSITHGWETTGESIWDQYYAGRNAFNIGFSGDRTEQVLWRLQHGEVDGLSPKLIVMMIGTNNTGHRQDPAASTAKGVEAIVNELETRMPDAKILLLAIFPRGETRDDPMRQLNTEINAKLAKLADHENVTFLDIGDQFLDDDGVLSKTIMPDLLHPNPNGYKIWAEAIEPTVAETVGSKAGQ